MPLVRWCSNCWHENPYGAAVCEACGADLREETGDRTERLIRSLGHPLPEIRRMAAGLLGRCDDARALTALAESARRAVKRRDWELLEGVVEGLAVSTRAQAITALEYISTHGAVRTRQGAARALAAIRTRRGAALAEAQRKGGGEV